MLKTNKYLLRYLKCSNCKSNDAHVSSITFWAESHYAAFKCLCNECKIEFTRYINTEYINMEE